MWPSQRKSMSERIFVDVDIQKLVKTETSVNMYKEAGKRLKMAKKLFFIRDTDVIVMPMTDKVTYVDSAM